MRRSRVVGICLATALALTAVVASSAAAATITIKEAKGAALKNGSAIKGFSSNLKFTTSSGNLECTENTMLGTLTENSGAPTNGLIESGTFTGAGGAECNTTFPLKPKAKITAENFSWKLTAEEENATTAKDIIKEGTKGPIAFTAVIKGLATCKFEAASLTSTSELNKAPLTIKLAAKQKMTSKNGGLCPKEGELTGSFTLTSGGKELEAS